MDTEHRVIPKAALAFSLEIILHCRRPEGFQANTNVSLN